MLELAVGIAVFGAVVHMELGTYIHKLWYRHIHKGRVVCIQYRIGGKYGNKSYQYYINF